MKVLLIIAAIAIVFLLLRKPQVVTIAGSPVFTGSALHGTSYVHYWASTGNVVQPTTPNQGGGVFGVPVG